MADELWRLSATQAHELVKTKQVSCVDITKETINRIQEVNQDLNAIIDDLANTALVEAAHQDRLISQGTVNPLTGVTFTFKDTVNVRNRVLSRGMIGMSSNIAKDDSPVVSNVRRAGAHIIGRTNCSSNCLRWFTENKVYGITRNPFDHTKSPGGSSGGAAAAVASGMCSIAHGSDYAGSIRYPAWACGIYGFRPTVNLIPGYNYNFSEGSPWDKPLYRQLIATDGVLARTMDDIELAFKIMCMNGRKDPNWIPMNLDLIPENRPLMITTYYNKEKPIDPDIMESFNRCVQLFRDLGHIVEVSQIPALEHAEYLHKLLLVDTFSKNYQMLEKTQDDITQSVCKKYTQLFRFPPPVPKDLMQIYAERYRLMCDLSKLFNKYDLLISPVCYQRQYPLAEDDVSAEKTRHIVESLEPQISTSFLSLPGISVPTVLDKGLPMGVQLISAPFREKYLFQGARIIENHYGFNSLDHLA